MLGTWLPLALADILRAFVGPSVTQADITRRWGLDGLADAMQETETNAALDALAALGKAKG